MTKNKKNVKKYSSLAIKTGTEAGKKVIKTKLIVIGLIFLILIVGIIFVIQIIPLSPVAPSRPALKDIDPALDTDGDVTVSWFSVNADGLKIYRSADLGATWVYKKTVNPSYITSWADIGLADGTYQYKAKAYNTEGMYTSYSSYSNVVSVVVSTSAPPSPEPLNPPILNEIIPNVRTVNYVDLSWSTVSGAGGAITYEIWRSWGGVVWSLVKTTTATSWRDTGLISGNYRYKVRAYNVGEMTDYSNTIYFTVDLPPPDATVLYPISPSISTDGKITLEWAIVPTTTSYVLWRCKDDAAYIITKTTTLTYYIDSISFDGIYKYYVICKNADGNSKISNIESVTVEFPVLKLDTTTLDAISPSTDTDGSIELTWSSVYLATSYEIYRDKDNTGYELIRTTYLNTYIDSGLEAGYYSYKILCRSVDDTSDFSNIESVTVEIPVQITSTILDAIFPSINADGSIELSWSVVSLTVSYEIYQSVNGSSYESIKTTGLTSYIVSGLLDGEYSYKIICIDINGVISEDSNIESVTVILGWEEEVEEEEVDYTMTYTLVGVLIGLSVVAVVIISKRKKKKKKKQVNVVYLKN